MPQSRLGEQLQGVSLLLLYRRRVGFWRLGVSASI